MEQSTCSKENLDHEGSGGGRLHCLELRLPGLQIHRPCLRFCRLQVVGIVRQRNSVIYGLAIR